MTEIEDQVAHRARIQRNKLHTIAIQAARAPDPLAAGSPKAGTPPGVAPF